MRFLALLVGAAALVVAGAAFAQNAPATLRGSVLSIAADDASLNMRTRDGAERTIKTPPSTKFTLVVPASLDDIKTGSYVGVAAKEGDDGVMKALEVHIFPPAQRGVGEGFRPFDLAPGSTMTNGDVTVRVDGVAGPKLTVTYHGGQQSIVVDKGTPIVAFAPGARGDVKVGSAIIARGAAQADGTIEAAVILVGKDGLTPPM